MNLAKLIVQILLRKDNYEKGLNDAAKSAQSFASKAGTAVAAVGKAFTAVVGVISAVGGAMVGLTAKTILNGDEIDKASQKLNMSTDAYQKWAIALNLAGTDISTLSAGMRQMKDFTDKLSEGQAEQILSIEKLGIAYDDFMGMNVEDQFYAIVNGLQGVEDQTEKVSLAQAVFGNRTYQELLPLLNQEQGSVDELFEKFKKYNLILDERTIKLSAELNDKFTLMKVAVKKAGMSLAAEFFPEVSQATEGIMGLLTGSKDTNEALSDLTDGILGIFKKVTEKLPSLVEGAMNLFENIIDGLTEGDTLNNLVTSLVTAINIVLEKVNDKGFINKVTDAAFDLVCAIIDGVGELDFSEVIDGFLSGLIRIVKNFPRLIKSISEAIPNILKGILDYVKSPDFWQNLGELVEEIVRTFVSLIKIGFQAMGSFEDMIFEWLGIDEDWAKSLLRWIFNPGSAIGNLIFGGDEERPEEAPSEKGGGGRGIAVGGMMTYAQGGIFGRYLKGTAYVAGEGNTAEIVAHGRYGTGVANIDQIAAAEYSAHEQYDVKSTIMKAAEAIVNGVLQGMSNASDGTAVNVTVQIGEKQFQDFSFKAVNSSLQSKGLKTLNDISGY